MLRLLIQIGVVYAAYRIGESVGRAEVGVHRLPTPPDHRLLKAARR